jgi:hypothetical protein
LEGDLEHELAPLAQVAGAVSPGLLAFSTNMRSSTVPSPDALLRAVDMFGGGPLFSSAVDTGVAALKGGDAAWSAQQRSVAFPLDMVSEAGDAGIIVVGAMTPSMTGSRTPCWMAFPRRWRRVSDWQPSSRTLTMMTRAPVRDGRCVPTPVA